MSDKDRQIIEERAKVYGNANSTLDAIGLVWTGILEQHYGIDLKQVLPGNVVALMMAGMKLVRASSESGKTHTDSYIDSRNYATLAEEYVNGKVQP